WTKTYQSLFGREEWLRPYTEDKLVELARAGAKKVFVALPGFTPDRLETLEEIGHEARETFLHAGGEELHPCPRLNDHPACGAARAGRGWRLRRAGCCNGAGRRARTSSGKRRCRERMQGGRTRISRVPSCARSAIPSPLRSGRRRWSRRSRPSIASSASQGRT